MCVQFVSPITIETKPFQAYNENAWKWPKIEFLCSLLWFLTTWTIPISETIFWFQLTACFLWCKYFNKKEFVKECRSEHTMHRPLPTALSLCITPDIPRDRHFVVSLLGFYREMICLEQFLLQPFHYKTVVLLYYASPKIDSSYLEKKHFIILQFLFQMKRYIINF